MESRFEKRVRSRLHRSHKERIVFGVCGGIAEYFDVDPNLVRVAFVALAFIPPISVLSLVGYPLLAIVLPGEGTEHLAPRDALRGNVTALRAEVEDLAGKVSAGVAGVAGAQRPAPTGGRTAGGPTEIPPAPAVGAHRLGGPG
jgi:phage shock protein PspC (stress-responsive transcriptional regulator)